MIPFKKGESFGISWIQTTILFEKSLLQDIVCDFCQSNSHSARRRLTFTKTLDRAAAFPRTLSNIENQAEPCRVSLFNRFFSQNTRESPRERLLML